MIAQRFLVALSLIGVPAVPYAYELGTHARLTNSAFAHSLLNKPGFLEEIGLVAGNPAPFGVAYYDVAGADLKERQFSDVETKQMPDGALPLSISGWLMRGAIREDDCVNHKDCLPGNSDPYNGKQFPTWKFDNRPLHHFYDPFNDEGLNLGGVEMFKSPNWILGTADAFSNQNIPELGRRNHFSVFDGREAMYRALTGRDSQGAELKPADGGTLKTQEVIRKAYWATTFRVLGDLVHHVQDMAQPQHTRNDPHGGEHFDGLPEVKGHKSVYESYINARATGQVFTTKDFSVQSKTITVTPPALDTLLQEKYPIPQFADYLSYYTTRHKHADIEARQGMADYSNRGFFSAGTNIATFKSHNYEYPPQSLDAYTEEPLSVDWEGNPLSQNANVKLLAREVKDSLSPDKTQKAKLSTRSAWDQFLVEKGWLTTQTLNRYNYDDMASLLIPRAVAYSAGLINHFFRGKIDLVPDPSKPGKYTLKNLGPDDMNGSFELYYDDKDGKRHPVPGASWNGVAVAKGATIGDISFEPLLSQTPASQNEYMLVFRGAMGTEVPAGGTVGAVAGKRIIDPIKLNILEYIYFSSESPTPYYYYGMSMSDVSPETLAAFEVAGNALTINFNGVSYPCDHYKVGGFYCANFNGVSDFTAQFEVLSSGGDPAWFSMWMSTPLTQEVVLGVGETKIFSFRPNPTNTGSGNSDVTFSGLMRVDTKQAKYFQ